MLLTDSIKALLGKQVKILFKNVVRLETKGDKTENRVLVSIYLFSTFKTKYFFSLLYFEISYFAPLTIFVISFTLYFCGK